MCNTDATTSALDEFYVGALYDYEGIPGMPEPTGAEHNSGTRLGTVIRVDAVDVFGNVLITTGTRLNGPQGGAFSWGVPARVRITDALALIERGIWDKH